MEKNFSGQHKCSYVANCISGDSFVYALTIGLATVKIKMTNDRIVNNPVLHVTCVLVVKTHNLAAYECYIGQITRSGGAKCNCFTCAC